MGGGTGKKKKQENFWTSTLAQTLMNVGATFGLAYLGGITQGLKPGQAATVAGVSVLAPIVGVPVQAQFNPDGTKAALPYKKDES